ncbi:hypothetical protein X922_11490 [Pseudomonas aeruginosa VRFPA08]|nr:hypothetical protein X922_11490 [Pseudomonas aeruginosa VRFPA08]
MRVIEPLSTDSSRHSSTGLLARLRPTKISTLNWAAVMSSAARCFSRMRSLVAALTPMSWPMEPLKGKSEAL